MADQATTSSTTNLKTVYSKGTHNLLKLVIKGLKHEDSDPENVMYGSFERAARLTGLPKDRLMCVMKEEKINNELKKTIERKTIHYELTDFYMKERAMPTCIQLFNRLQFNIPYHVDIHTFQDTLVSLGYMFKRKGNMTVIIENPKIRFERYMYLKNIKRHRQNERDIYYIGEFAVIPKCRVLNLEESMSANATPLNFIRYICAVSADTDAFLFVPYSELNEDYFRNFICSKLLPHLERPSVIVYDNAKHHNGRYCNQLNGIENSFKDEIIEWLQYHKIPCSGNMSKLQLWKLAENFTDVYEDTYIMDELIRHNGHEILRLPDCINDLTLVAAVRQSLHNSGKELPDLSFNKEYLKRYNSALITEESTLLDLELELDDLMDNLGDPVIDPLSDNTITGANLELPCTDDID